MNTLLLISIGPVQEFIATARKLRDLWFGSYLLSELSKTVARTLAENGADLIFPAPDNEDDLKKGSSFIVANKILAMVENPEQADRIQETAHAAWRAHLQNLGIETVKEIEKRFKSVNTKLFNAQMADYGEFFAVWTSFESESDYSQARSRAEDLLSSRKNLRSFSAPLWDGAGIPKNSLDGFRECVTPEKVEIRGLLKKGEKLDAMGCIKRFHLLSDDLETKHFLDLADLSLVPWLQGLDGNSDAQVAIKAFQDSIYVRDEKRNKNKRQISSFIPLHIEAEIFFATKDELKSIEVIDAQEAWKRRSLMVKECGEPPLYSIIMSGDGDYMGRMIDAIQSPEIHKQFSKKLSEFSVEAAELIHQYHGSLVYAGGDDVMAYLPLHTAVACANEIRKRFSEAMQEVHAGAQLDCQVPTFSAGLAIVHHSCPLDQALNLARKAERIAKNQGGRNALAIIQSKRSGSDIVVYGKWDKSGKLPGIVDRIKTIISFYDPAQKLLPSRLGYDLRQVSIESGCQEMEFESIGNKLEAKNATAALVKRIFDHKNDGNSEKNIQLLELLAGRRSVRQLSNELVVCRQIAEAKYMSQGGRQNT